MPLPEGTCRCGFQVSRWLALAGAILAAVVLAVWAFAFNHDGRVGEQSLRQPISLESGKPARTEPIESGSLGTRTPAERELDKLLRGKDEAIDLAVANWLIVADIPQFRDVTREAYFRELDALTEQVRQDMATMRANGGASARGNDGATRCRLFCSAIQRQRFAYTEEFRQEELSSAQLKALYADANQVFLAGLLRTRRGSCVSMPLIYLVIGQRLGLPVHLVTLGRHYFIRWEEPGYRMNIETTIVDRIAVTPDDAVYMEAEGLTREKLEGSQLRNLTRREVVGNLFYTRSCYWGLKGAAGQDQNCRDLA